jgi:protease-4
MGRKTSGCLVALLVAALVASLFANLCFFAGRGSAASDPAHGPEDALEESIVHPSKTHSPHKIALLELTGIISGMEPGAVSPTAVEDLEVALRKAATDPKVRAVVLRIDSPGGEVTASDVLYRAVRNVRDQSGKPVVVSMGSMAASGGYYVACAGSWIVAHETTFTGSIGVIMQSLNYQQLFQKIGLESVTFKSGPFKDMLSGSRPISEAEREYVQKLILQTYDLFVGIVAKERRLDEPALRSTWADGRVISGKDAHAARLVDQLGTLDDACAKAIELAAAPDAAVVRYKSRFQFGRWLELLSRAPLRRVELQLPQPAAARLEPGRPYYLPTFYAQ